MSSQRCKRPALRRVLYRRIFTMQTFFQLVAVSIPYAACLLLSRNGEPLDAAGRSTFQTIATATYTAAGLSLLSNIIAWLQVERLVTRPLLQLVASLRHWNECGVPAPRRLKTQIREIDVLNALFGMLFGKMYGCVDELARLVGEIAHDMRTPLKHLKDEVALYRKGLSSADELADLVAEEELLLEAAIDRNISLTKGYSPVIGAPPARMNLVREIESCLGGFASEATRRNLSLEMKAVSGLLVVYTQRQKLESIVHNLVANAVKFTPDGGRIRVSARATDARIPGVTIAVEDTGPGVPEAERELVFDECYRSETTRQVEGTGLGLATVKRLARDCGGDCTCGESPLGGARFEATLPILLREPDEPLRRIARILLRFVPERKRWFFAAGAIPPLGLLAVLIVYDLVSPTLANWTLIASVSLGALTTPLALGKAFVDAVLRHRLKRAGARATAYFTGLGLGSAIAEYGRHVLMSA